MNKIVIALLLVCTPIGATQTQESTQPEQLSQEFSNFNAVLQLISIHQLCKHMEQEQPTKCGSLRNLTSEMATAHKTELAVGFSTARARATTTEERLYIEKNHRRNGSIRAATRK